MSLILLNASSRKSISATSSTSSFGVTANRRPQSVAPRALGSPQRVRRECWLSRVDQKDYGESYCYLGHTYFWQVKVEDLIYVTVNAVSLLSLLLWIHLTLGYELRRFTSTGAYMGFMR
ncbi:hypothetical protein BOTBODRAFT_27463 [Botryobasidium botryosum FD-172 SS1]|uniref:Uncharacterized protein n=1 Tax=Botryobasidium botryosum (strain FD-172 SS1) TaxID=930990 RepID=A0A067MWB3_BOTB1|nr:hypothetical protein BOTBODRAFT_27463 [Botryobasidium botryosum FD-172 SS1]